MVREYYKKVDKSFFKYGITIPNDYVDLFLFDEEIPLGESRTISVVFKDNKHICKLYNVNRKNAPNVYQIRWDKNFDLLSELKKEFIQSFFAIVSQDFSAKEKKKYYITNLLGGNQEVVIFKPLNADEIILETFIHIETPYDNIFRSLIDQNVFGWINKEEVASFTTKSTKWFDISDLYQHEDVAYVVYYLLDETNKEIYIGSAKKLGDRVKEGRKEIPEWNKFRYEVVHPLFQKYLREIEYHSIMNFARFFKNNGRLSSFDLCEYTLVNRDYKYYQK